MPRKIAISLKKFISASSMNQFILPNLVNLWSFRKIRCKLSEIWEPKFANIFQEMYARGQFLPPGMHFFVNSGSRIFESLQWAFLKLRRLAKKFGAINRFMETNFCFNEKQKKFAILRNIVNRSIIPAYQNIALWIPPGGGGGEGTPYNGLYGEAPPERGTFSRLEVYKRVGISRVGV